MQSNNKKNRIIKSDGKTSGKRRRRAPAKSRGRLDIYGDAIGQLRRDVASLVRVINTEAKFLDQVWTNVAIDNTGTQIYLSNGMQQGLTASTRQGQSIHMDIYELNFTITNNATAINTYTRVMIVVDKQPNAAALSTAGILNSVVPSSQYIVGQQRRFIMLYDSVFALSTAGPSNLSMAISASTNQHVQYNTGNAGTIADIVTNSVYVILFSDQAVNTTTFNGYGRLYFRDN